MFSGFLRIVGGIVSFAGEWLTQRGRAKDREAGRNEEKVKGFQDAEDAQERIDAVKRPDDDDSVDILRKGEF